MNIYERLEEWARWLKSGTGVMLGVPSQNIIARLMVQGAGASTGGDRWQTVGPENPDAERMDRAICRLDKKLKKAILARYYWGLSYRVGGVVLGCTKDTFKSRVERAESLLAVDTGAL